MYVVSISSESIIPTGALHGFIHLLEFTLGTQLSKAQSERVFDKLAHSRNLALTCKDQNEVRYVTSVMIDCQYLSKCRIETLELCDDGYIVVNAAN